MKRVKYFLLIMFFPLFVYAQEKDYSKEPGYVDFGDLTQFENEDNMTEVLLDENILKMVSNMKDKDGKAELLSKLKLIKVNVFQMDKKNSAAVKNKITEIDKNLMSRNWNRIVKTRDKGDFANVYIKQNANNKIDGLVVTTIDNNDEAAFVNIVGQIDLEEISKLGDDFNIPSLNDVKNK